jgi:hypothetical protein
MAGHHPHAMAKKKRGLEPFLASKNKLGRALYAEAF